MSRFSVSRVTRLLTAVGVLGVVATPILPTSVHVSALDASFVPRLIAGGGLLGHSPNGDVIAGGRISYPLGMAVHPVSGEFFYSQGASENGADLNDQFPSVRRVLTDGKVQTLVGNDSQSDRCTSNCDGTVATNSQQLRNPGHMVFNSSGTELLMLDGFNGVRRMTFSGSPALPTSIATVTYTQLPTGITSPSQMLTQGGLALDSSGAIYFGARVLDSSMSSLLRLSVMKRSATGELTDVVSSVANIAPTTKVGSSQFSGVRDLKVVGNSLYVLYDNKLLRTDLDGNLEAEYSFSDTQARSVAVINSTIYVGLSVDGRVVSFSDNAANSQPVTPTLMSFLGSASSTNFLFSETRANIELSGPRSMMVHRGSLYLSDMKSLSAAIVGLVPPPDTTAPTLSTAVLNSTGSTLDIGFNEALDANSVPDTSAFAVAIGGVTRSVTSVAISGSSLLLTLSGSPVDSNASITVSYAVPGQNPLQDEAGNSVAAISNRAVTNSSTVSPPSTTTTVAPTTTIAVASNTAAPTLVTSANQAALTATPGGATALINGVAVTPQIVTASNSAAAQTDPAERTPEQVRELQQAATTIETRLDTIAGGDSGVSVVRTDTGAVMTGIFSGTRVPVEDVVVVNAADTATLFAARDVRGNIVEVKPGAVLEVASNGDVAVQAFGLRAGETVELVVMSTPTLLGTYTVDAKGSIKTTAKLPTSIGTGNHSLVVASPSVKASLGLKLVKSSATLPVTGSTTTDLSNWAVAVLLSGVYVMLASRSRRRVF
jgi:hypothetical protein